MFHVEIVTNKRKISVIQKEQSRKERE